MVQNTHWRTHRLLCVGFDRPVGLPLRRGKPKFISLRACFLSLPLPSLLAFGFPHVRLLFFFPAFLPFDFHGFELQDRQCAAYKKIILERI